MATHGKGRVAAVDTRSSAAAALGDVGEQYDLSAFWQRRDDDAG